MWTMIEVAGHECELFEPTRRNPHGFILIYLHGVHLNRLSDHAEFTTQFERHGLPVIGPRTARSWWTDRICAEFDPSISAEAYVCGRVLPFAETRFGAIPPRIGLFGTSMGGQGALRLAFQRPNVFPVVAAISPAIDFQLRWDEGDETLPLMYEDREAARQDTATLHVHPLNYPRRLWFCCDPSDYRWHESAERLRSKLAALGVPHVADLETTGGGHGFEYYNRMAPTAIDFLADGLERERLRVV